MPIPARILLVEDHTDTLFMLTRLLESRGFDVVRADSCQSAREAAGTKKSPRSRSNTDPGRRAYPGGISLKA